MSYHDLSPTGRDAMLNEAIVGQLFSMFKEEYGYAVDDAAGLFDGQRDMLESS
jgi:hypothetical protein